MYRTSKSTGILQAPYVVVENAGRIKNIEQALEMVNNRIGQILSQYEFEQLLSHSDEMELFDADGGKVDDIKDAALKIIKLNGLFGKYDNLPVCVSFVKQTHNAEKYGHNSDDSWAGCYVGHSDALYDKWRDYLEGRNDSAGQEQKIGSIGQVIADKGLLGELNKMTEGNVGKIRPKMPPGADAFLKELYEVLYIKENWLSPDGGLSRLKDYIDYLALKISTDADKENCMKYNKSGDRVVFNSRLLSKYGNYVILCGKTDGSKFYDYKIAKSAEFLRELGFESSDYSVPPVKFFTNLDEVIFSGNAADFDMTNMYRLTHVIEERRDRLPEEMREMNPIDISTRLMGCVTMALNIAQTDYKFIVPMYNFTHKKIQFLMPVYTSFTGVSRPECALAIDKNDNGKWEIMSVLDIEMAYRSARLINRPDQNWLNLE